MTIEARCGVWLPIEHRYRLVRSLADILPPLTWAAVDGLGFAATLPRPSNGPSYCKVPRAASVN